MKLNIGENIRRLRAAKGWTREMLAHALRISDGMVVRWEESRCYPDIEQLPAIATLFGVTVDELIGMDELRSKNGKDALITKALNLERQSDWAGAIEILRDALRTWPTDDALKAELAMAYSKSDREADQFKAIELSEEILDQCADVKITSTVRANLCCLYKAYGQEARAIALGRTLPHIWECREVLIPAIIQESIREQATDYSLNVITQVLRDMVNEKSIPFSLGYKAEADVDSEALKAALKA